MFVCCVTVKVFKVFKKLKVIKKEPPKDLASFGGLMNRKVFIVFVKPLPLAVVG